MTTNYPSDSLATAYPTPTSSTGGHASNGQHSQQSQSMDARSGEYSQSGMVEPPPSSPETQQRERDHPESSSKPTRAPIDPNSTHFASNQEVKYNPATPDSNYSLNPPSARSGTFPDSYLPRSAGYPDGSQRYQQPNNSTPNGAAGNMAQPQSPSTMPSAEGQPAPPQHPSQQVPVSNPEIPVDPSIAQSSPTYPSHHYSPYPTPDSHHMQYQTPPMYARPPEYSQAPPYSAPHQPIPYGHAVTSVSSPPNMDPAGARPPGVSVTP